MRGVLLKQRKPSGLEENAFRTHDRREQGHVLLHGWMLPLAHVSLDVLLLYRMRVVLQAQTQTSSTA